MIFYDIRPDVWNNVRALKQGYLELCKTLLQWGLFLIHFSCNYLLKVLLIYYFNNNVNRNADIFWGISTLLAPGIMKIAT